MANNHTNKCDFLFVRVKYKYGIISNTKRKRKYRKNYCAL